MSSQASISFTNTPSPSPPQTKAWQPLPPVQTPPRWNPEEFANKYGRRIKSVVAPRYSQKHYHPNTPNGYCSSTRSLNHIPSSSVNGEARVVPDTSGSYYQNYQQHHSSYHSELSKSQSCEALNHRPDTPLSHWVPGPASAPANLRHIGFEGRGDPPCGLNSQDGFYSTDTSSQPERLYSLFNGGGGSLFSPTLIAPSDGCHSNMHSDNGGDRLAAVAESWK